MNDVVETLLDVLGLLLVAAGVGYAVTVLIDDGRVPGLAVGLAVMGLIVLFGSFLAQRIRAGQPDGRE